MITDYQINLTKNQWKSLPEIHFKNSTDGKEASQETIVKLRYDDDFLYVEFDCRNNPFTLQNTYTEHNTPMYNQEVFELFISDELETPKHYLEFEINPNNAIWTGFIENPTGKAPLPTATKMVAPEQTGITHSVKAQKDSWSGSFQIPFKLIGKKQKEYRINFYRIISTKSHSEKNWSGSPADCLYLCWSPTMSGKMPAFHRPAAFGKLVLE